MDARKLRLTVFGSLVALGAVTSAGCRSRAQAAGACGRIAGNWVGETAEADPGHDPEALRVMRDVIRDERWRITRVTDHGLQRERTGAAGGRAVAEAMYVKLSAANRCVVDITVAGTPRPLELTLRADGRLAVRNPASWFTAVYRRP